LVDAFTRLAETTGEARWMDRAADVADHLIAEFHDHERGGFFTVAAGADPLVVRQKDLMDNATPSANSTAAMALLRLGTLLGRDDFSETARGTLRLLVRIMEAAPSAAGQSLAALDLAVAGVVEVVLAGDVPALARAVDDLWLPRAVVARGEPYPSPLWDHRSPGFAYVCENYTCAAPTADVTTLRTLLG
ncbi:MAG: thioredoxin domain-containing protein, partial [Actinomycetota bacterium]